MLGVAFSCPTKGRLRVSTSWEYPSSWAIINNILVNQLHPFVDQIFQVLHSISQDFNRSEGLMRATMGVLGDLADAFPNGEFAAYFRNDWVTSLVRETRTNREYSPRTVDTARWTREQVKRQITMSTAAAMA